jgi:iron only hydrogenase large subunit-like protein
MGLKSSHWSCLKDCFKGYTFCFIAFLVRPSTGAQQSHERAPKNVKMTLKDQSFVNKVSFVCVQPWRRVTFKFWEMLKNVSEVILVTKNIFFLKILNFVQSFVECKVSLADGTVICRSLVLQRLQEVAHYPLTSSCCPPGNTLLFAFNV